METQNGTKRWLNTEMNRWKSAKANRTKGDEPAQVWKHPKC